ncbi:MAG: hypothetical protein JEY91_05565 [Spirochaetaceae bacterium]|nr:hypothetical protein [Spirochaetaceae bacterium]
MDKNCDYIKLTFLLDNCPVLHDNPKDCPLYSLRGKSIEDKHKWLSGLSEAQISEILFIHSQCYSASLISL